MNDVDKIREYLSKLTIPTSMEFIPPITTIINTTEFIEHNLLVVQNHNYKKWTKPYYHRVLRLISIIENRNIMVDHTNQSDEDKLNICRDLWYNHKIGIAWEDDYDEEKFDLLEKLGIIKLSKLNKLDILDKTRLQYKDLILSRIPELTNQSLIDRASSELQMINTNSISKELNNTLINRSKVFALKQFFDNQEEIF